MNSSRTALICAATLLVLLGCNPRRPKKFSSPEDMERYASLPFASATHNAELRAELARVVAEGGTPAQLGGLAGSTDPPADGQPDHSIVVALTEIFPADTRDLLVERLRSVYPDARFQFAPLARGTARDLLQAADERRGKFQRLMLTASLRPSYPHALGIGADVNYLTAVEAGNRLTGIYIAELLETNRVPQAMESLNAMFRVAEWLSQEKHPLPRIAGARQRAAALVVLGAIARHPHASPEIRGQLQELLTRQLSHWPTDADAWIGERAEGLHMYELIRDGYLLSVLPFENLRRLREEIGVDKLGQVVADHLDADELFFSATMRKFDCVLCTTIPSAQRRVRANRKGLGPAAQLRPISLRRGPNAPIGACLTAAAHRTRPRAVYGLADCTDRGRWRSTAGRHGQSSHRAALFDHPSCGECLRGRYWRQRTGHRSAAAGSDPVDPAVIARVHSVGRGTLPIRWRKEWDGCDG